jgi:hypothetical protein
MYFPVRIYGKDGKLKKVISSKKLSEISYQTLNDMAVPNMRKAKKYHAAWIVYTCRNCGVRAKSKKDTAFYCSAYCAGYYARKVKTKEAKPFRSGGLDDFPLLKSKLESIVQSKRIFVKGEYEPIKITDD